MSETKPRPIGAGGPGGVFSTEIVGPPNCNWRPDRLVAVLNYVYGPQWVMHFPEKAIVKQEDIEKYKAEFLV